jgi:wyosine [tRNA(Phe)-imidazoG37] synthetase (radical SAM superfamily)
MSLPPLERIVYGPVRSRRLGASLGINLLPAGLKLCNMNCAYCQYGWSRGGLRGRERGERRTGWPSARAVEAAVTHRLARAKATGEMLDRITVAGHGEPTLHPDFEAISERLAGVRDRVAPGLKTAVLSNSTTASWGDVKRGLGFYDERYMKLDAGDALTFARINGVGGVDRSVTAVIDALRQLDPIIVQAMFVVDTCHEVENCGEGAVAAWLTGLERTGAARVQIYTIDRPPALTSLRPVPQRRLREIAEQVRAAGMIAEVFPPSGAWSQ